MQNKPHHGKGHKNYARKYSWKVWTFLFEATLALENMLFVYLGNSLYLPNVVYPEIKSSFHSWFPCIDFVLKIMIPKKGSKPKNFMKHTIYRWFQVPAPTLRHLRPFLTFFLIFLDFYLMISWNSTWQNPLKPVFAGKV